MPAAHDPDKTICSRITGDGLRSSAASPDTRLVYVRAPTSSVRPRMLILLVGGRQNRHVEIIIDNPPAAKLRSF